MGDRVEEVLEKMIPELEDLILKEICIKVKKKF